MKLPRNRWLKQEGNDAVVQFGKHKGDTLSGLLVSDRGYIHFMLEKFEDLPDELRRYLLVALEIGHDPVRNEEPTPLGPVLRAEERLSELKAKAADKAKRASEEEAKAAIQSRRDNAEW